MEPTSETRVLDTPCVICGGTITITVEIADSQHPGWVTTIECENQCDLSLVSSLLGKKWESQSHSRKAALEKYSKMETAIVNEISEARHECEFCGKIPQLKTVGKREYGYKFHCGCPPLNSVIPRPTISGAASFRCARIKTQRTLAREETLKQQEKQRKLASHRHAVNQFNQRSKELS